MVFGLVCVVGLLLWIPFDQERSDQQKCLNSIALVCAACGLFSSPFPSFQGPEALCGCHIWGWGSQPGFPHGDVHFLCGLLRCVPLLFRQHICGFDHHHLSGARRQGHGGVQPGEERGEIRGCSLLFILENNAVRTLAAYLCWSTSFWRCFSLASQMFSSLAIRTHADLLLNVSSRQITSNMSYNFHKQNRSTKKQNLWGL